MSAAAPAGDLCGAVHVGHVTQNAGSRLEPPSAPVKVVLRTQLVTEMSSPGAPLLLVLHVKQDRAQCSPLLLGFF